MKKACDIVDEEDFPSKMLIFTFFQTNDFGIVFKFSLRLLANLPILNRLKGKSKQLF